MKSRGGSDSCSNFNFPGNDGIPGSTGNLRKKRRWSTTAGSDSQQSVFTGIAGQRNQQYEQLPFQPISPDENFKGYRDTIVATNPFDDTPAPPPSIINHPGMMMIPSHDPRYPHPQDSPTSMTSMSTMHSGRIYPHDQPMVFNPQNPNAPPIHPCGVCHKEVHDNDQAILCESGCNFWFHRVCSGLTDATYHFLKQEIFAEWVCDACISTKDIPLVKFKS